MMGCWNVKKIALFACSGILAGMMSVTASAVEDTVLSGNNTKSGSEYMIDTLNSSEYYESSDRFANSSTGNVSINGYHRWVQYAGDYAEFTKTDVEIGNYEVFYYLPLQHAGNVKKPLFRIESADGNVKEQSIDISGYASGAWVSLGTYPFAEGMPMSVQIVHPGIDAAYPEGKTIRANAVKLVKSSDLILPPSAKNLTLTGSLAVGAELIGRYGFEDPNDATESGSIYRFFRSDTIEGGNQTELISGEAVAETNITYQTMPEDSGKYIVMEIIPRSEGGKAGDAARIVTGPIADAWYPPVADQVRIEGQPWVDHILTGSYRYFDQNGEKESGTAYAWQYADSPDSENWTVYSEGIVSDRVPEVKIHETQAGTYIRLQIIPKNESLVNSEGVPVYSDIIGPVSVQIVQPVVEEVTLDGQIVKAEGLEGAAVDGSANIHYSYSHVLGYEEAGALFQWYISESGQGDFAPLPDQTERSLLITAEMAGKFVKASVVVKDEKQQYSQPAYSKPLQVKWKLGFHDEFDYRAVDGNDAVFKEKWISDSSQRVLGSPEIKSARIPENVEVKDGALYIHNRKEHNEKYNFDHTWTTGNIKTVQNEFKYGYYEASYKLALATGLNQSFWMMSDKVMDAGKFVEADFNEGHYPYEVATNLHYTEDGSSRKVNSLKYYPYGKGETTLASGFNKLAGILEPNQDGYAWDSAQNSDTYRVYINDQLNRSTKSLPYEPEGSRIYFSVAIYPGFAGALIDAEADGTSMVVDYVRYYEPLN